MKIDQIFIGDIRKCTKYEMHNTFSTSCSSVGYIEDADEVYKENAVLIKIERYGGYVDLERFHSVLDYFRIWLEIQNGNYLGGLMMSTSAHCVNSLFVDEKSLKPYCTDNQQTDNISIRQLKQQVKNRQ